MSLREQITNDIKTAMKSKEMDKLNALRLVQSAFKNREIELRPNSMSEDEHIAVLKKLVKQRKESAEIYKTQNREDLYDIEMQEMQVIEPYLPKQMSHDEIEAYLNELIGRVGATSVKDMGKVMGAANKELAGKADGRTISEVVKKLLL